MRRADAHIHLFMPGYADLLPERCRRQDPSELTLYSAYAEQYQISAALVVGYEGAPWADGNNRYLAELVTAHAWVRPTAFLFPATLTVSTLEQLQREGFVGISLYLFTADDLRALSEVSEAVWRWLVQQRWLVSVNSRGEAWSTWLPILERQPELRLLISHLGLPPRCAVAPGPEAMAALLPVCALARFPNSYVKLSGFYALSDPGYDYPHRSAWPYVTELVAAFGPHRLLWGSDYSPSLEWVSFPQTLRLLEQIPDLDAAVLPLVVGENLLALLASVG